MREESQGRDIVDKGAIRLSYRKSFLLIFQDELKILHLGNVDKDGVYSRQLPFVFLDSPLCGNLCGAGFYLLKRRLEGARPLISSRYLSVGTQPRFSQFIWWDIECVGEE